ncbi:MAG: acetate--CoA ligase family protein [Thermofilum sp.]|nr:acetate--CoA ligase family protein [Thermofilum sp.]
MGAGNLWAILRPRSVAVIGASRDPSKIGSRILRNILSSGFRGAVYPVNPNASEVLGLRCYASVLDVPGPVDLAVVAVPAKLVPQVVEECGRKGVGAVAVISSGFKEVGNEELERRVVETARKHGLRILGPNIVGVWDTRTPINYSFIDANPLPGSIAFVSQSGALMTSLLWWTRERGIGFSCLVSIGNRADVGEADLLALLREDPETRVVAIYMEGLGEGEGRRFLEEASKTAAVKPVIVLKAGRSEAAAEAIRSHTGSLAGSDEVYEAALKQARALRAPGLRELFNWALALALSPEPGEGTAVILTHGGGAGVIAADALNGMGVPLAPLPQDLQERLRKFMPPFGSARNPVDLTGMMTAESLRGALVEVLRDPRVGAVLVWAGQGAIPTPEELGEAVLSAVREAGLAKPLVVSITGGEECRGVLRKLIQAGVPAYESPEDAASALAAVYRYYRRRKERKGEPARVEGDRARAGEIIGRARAEGRALLTPVESFEVARAYGIPVVEHAFAPDLEAAAEAARRIGYPVALAVETPDVAHKTEVGGIALNVKSEEELREAYARVMGEFARRAPGARVFGVSVRKMVPRGFEVFVGARRDPVFGPVVSFGWGGVEVELIRDVSVRVAPLTWEDVEEMVAETRAGRVLKGYRGPPLDEGAVKSAIAGVAALIEDFEEVAAVDVNPIFVYEKGAVAVDVKVYLRA